MSDEHRAAKVLFRILDTEGGVDVETLWALDLGNDHYCLDNSPFYAYSVSWEDIVYAPHDEDEGFATFQRVVTKSGNRTVRIIFDPPVEEGNESDFVLQALVELGCSYEGSSPSYIAVNIPPTVDLQTVRQYLIEKEARWEHADPSYAELFPDDL
ncbi:MAG TPA: DUF4265 domain-containing protein [Blastocatellia bacterium]|jgi:hypothetical protein|nr:DUF4265 domain-containing protein [Blastocatellia bacterium]